MTPTLYWIDEGSRRDRLAILPRPRGGDWIADEMRALKGAGIDVLVSALTHEESRELELDEEARLSEVNGISFVSFPILDRGVPEKKNDMARLIHDLESALASGKKIGFHCRQGIGRSSLLLACLLTAMGMDPEEAFDRIAKARACPVPDTQEQRAWVRKFANEFLLSAKKSDS